MRWGNLSAECFLRPKSDLRSCGEKRRLRNHPAERELLLRDFRDALRERMDQRRAEKHEEDLVITSLTGSDSEMAPRQGHDLIRNVARCVRV
jgi:hypothetical protein